MFRKILQLGSDSHHRFLFLLLSLVFIILVAPFTSKTPASNLLLNIFAALVLVVAIFELRDAKKIMVIAICLALLAMVTHAVYLIYHTNTAHVIDSIAAILFLGFVSIRIFSTMLHGGVITTATIYGAMCIYLLIGIIFGDIYTIIENLQPGSFATSGLQANQMLPITRFNLTVFSYAMLTTVGHSKIVTQNMFADSVVIIEQLVGVLYLAVLIARLVTGFSSTHKDKL